jgi:hypothetical protein
MIAEIQPLKDRITNAGRATRDDITEALGIIRANGADPESEIVELVDQIYNADQTAKLVSSLGSY